MGKTLIFKYISYNREDVVASEWNSVFSRYFVDKAFACRLENGEMSASNSGSREQIKIYFSTDNFLDLHEVIIKGDNRQVTRRCDETTRLYRNLGFKPLN